MQNGDDLPDMASNVEMDGKQIKMRIVQRDGRVDVPSEWLDALSIEEGDNIHLVADPEEETVTIKKADPENVL